MSVESFPASQDERPLFTVSNHHAPHCGAPPAVTGDEPGVYHGYFENSHGEQFVFLYRRNTGERCYWCRRTLFRFMEAWAERAGFAALAYGEITDDLADVRPGRRAATELGIVAPLRAAGFSKDDVRRYARAHGLAVAEKPASACLASRVPFGTEVTVERLRRIERAEEDVRALGFRVLRVRDHGRRARVEVGADELVRARAVRARLEDVLRASDFDEVELAAYGAARAGL